MSPETTSFVEALEAVLQAEDKTRSAYFKTYGEGYETGKGGYMFNQTGTEAHFKELREELRDQISLSLEWEIREKLGLNRVED